MGIVSKRLITTLRKTKSNRLISTITLKTRMLQALINHKIHEKVKPIIQRLKSPLYTKEEDDVDTREVLLSGKSVTQESIQTIQTREIPKANSAIYINNKQTEDKMRSTSDRKDVRKRKWERTKDKMTKRMKKR